MKDAIFSLNDQLAAKGVSETSSKIPTDHQFFVRKTMGDQMLALLSVEMIPAGQTFICISALL